jgi:hypothetical protein
VNNLEARKPGRKRVNKEKRKAGIGAARPESPQMLYLIRFPVFLLS